MKYKFSGHQTFAFRYGWLEKGVRGMLEYPDLFSREDALVHLGVGKNMVESIRHWCTVAQLIEESAESKRAGAAGLKVSAIGRHLLSPRGWDSFLEDDASLWLIHWLLVSNPMIGTTWQIAFSSFQRGDYTKRELLDYVAAFAEKHGSDVNEGSLARDVDCFIRTYTPARSTAKQALAEESFDCPLQECATTITFRHQRQLHFRMSNGGYDGLEQGRWWRSGASAPPPQRGGAPHGGRRSRPV
jgi:hypothetical protein